MDNRTISARGTDYGQDTSVCDEHIQDDIQKLAWTKHTRHHNTVQYREHAKTNVHRQTAKHADTMNTYKAGEVY